MSEKKHLGDDVQHVSHEESKIPPENIKGLTNFILSYGIGGCPKDSFIDLYALLQFDQVEEFLAQAEQQGMIYRGDTKLYAISLCRDYILNFISQEKWTSIDEIKLSLKLPEEVIVKCLYDLISQGQAESNPNSALYRGTKDRNDQDFPPLPSPYAAKLKNFQIG